MSLTDSRDLLAVESRSAGIQAETSLNPDEEMEREESRAKARELNDFNP